MRRARERRAAARRPREKKERLAAPIARWAAGSGRVRAAGCCSFAYKLYDLVRVALLQPREVLVARVARRLEIDEDAVIGLRDDWRRRLH